ncbi:MAG: inorganic phosphate transporter [Anaerolineae bacterium]|nr:inorganic phosphate transporter [Anaerolineae bacterium]
MFSIPLQAVPLVFLAVMFGFLNGKNDAANIVAPLVSTRALGYRRALILAAVAEGTGPFLFGVAVAKTIGNGLIASASITLPVVYAAVLAAIVWNTLTLLLGIPSSTSHALAGGLIGAAWIGYGPEAILFDGLLKVVLALFLSPALGLIVGYGAIKLLYFLAGIFGTSPRVNNWFKRGQLVTAAALGLAHGSNDAQKTMGLITLGLVATGSLDHFYVPFWVVAISAAAIAGGTLLGGTRTMHTVGRKFYPIRPVHGFGAQAASSLIVFGAALFGGPVSTSHVVSSSIVGAGSADRVQMVRWQVAERVIFSWFVTIPSAATVAIVLYMVVWPVFP